MHFPLESPLFDRWAERSRLGVRLSCHVFNVRRFDCFCAQVCNLSVSIPSYGCEGGQGLFVFVFIIECVFHSHVCVFHTRQSFFVVFRPALVSITADGVDKLNDRVGCSNRPDPATETAHRRLFSALVLSPLYPLRFYFCPRHSWPLCLLPFFSQFSFSSSTLG